MKIEIEVLRVADVISRIVCKSPLSYHHHLKRLSRHDRIYVDAVSRTMAELSDKHAILFNGLINKLEISDENFDAVYKSVALEMFADGVINWGRIITLYAFAATIAQHFNDNGMENVADSMIHMNNQFIEEHLADWIVNKGGWVGIEVKHL